MSKRRLVSYCVLLALAISIGGCASDNPVGSSSTGSAPKAGSSFTIQGVTSNAAGQVVQSREIVTVVAENNVSYFGKTGLVKFVTTGAGSASYMSYEANGDLAALMYSSVNGVAVDSIWVTYPFVSQQPFHVPDLFGNMAGTPWSSEGDITYLGTETLTLAGETFTTQKVRAQTHMAMMTPDGDPVLEQSRVDTIWYAPKVKYIVKQSGIQHNITVGDTMTYYNVGTLKSYILQ